MRRARPILAALVFAAVSVAWAPAGFAVRRVNAAEAPDPFKARLVQNIAVVSRARAVLGAQARRKPPKGLTADQRRAYDEQTRWLEGTAGSFASIKGRMEAALAKPRASPSEIAQLNVEFGELRDKTESESRRFEALGDACRKRHAATIAALQG